MSITTSTERTRLGYGLGEEEGEAFWLFGMLATIKIGADDTAGRYCLIDVEVPPGVGSPWHVHRDEDEWFFVHDGEFTLYIGDARLTLTAGGFAFGPKGVPHTFIGGPHGGKMLAGCNGAKFEGLLREIAEPPASTFCRRRPRVRRTWTCSCPSRQNGRTTSSGPRAHPPAISRQPDQTGNERF
jgi:quercetin dioxygenase-like cupin family protein